MTGARGTILVTGASGFVGRRLAVGLRDAGWSVVAAGRSLDRLRACGLEEGPLLRLVAWDLADADDTVDLPPCDLVIHAAANAPPRPERPDICLTDNALGTGKVQGKALAMGCAGLIFLSTLSVYGRIGVPEVDEHTDIVNPGVYGLSKLMGEHLLAQRAADLPCLVLRLPGVVGPGVTTPWLARVVGRIREGATIPVFNPQAPFNNAVHTADLVSFMDTVGRDLLGRPARGIPGNFDVLTLAAAGTVTVREAVGRLFAAQQRPETIEVMEEAKPSFTVSSARARRLYGYAPQDIATILDRLPGEVPT